ncbi:S9 family peptidase [Nonomuraea sp. NPDC050404]|uniref:TolB family protein n=1 Tax=Nonomuraea sp. NPDC050404 TaxID=3155783 RepID=UPI0033E39F82
MNAGVVTAELVVDIDMPLDPVVSPDGRWVAYVVAAMGRRAERGSGAIWVAAADGSVPPRRVSVSTVRDRLPRWAADSCGLFFLSDRGGSTQLCRVALEGGEPEQLTSWGSGIDDHLPLACGRLVAVVAADEPAGEDGRGRDEGDDVWVWGQKEPCGRLWLLDLDSGRMRVVDGLGDRHVAELAQRQDGGALAVLSWAGPVPDPVRFVCELQVVDVETGRVRDLGETEPEACSPVWWRTEDGWRLCYLATTPPGPVGGRAVFDLAVPEVAVVSEVEPAREVGAAREAEPAREVGAAREAESAAEVGAARAAEVGGLVAARNLTDGMTVCPSGLAQVPDGPPLALFADGLDTAICRLDPGTRRFERLSMRPGFAGSLSAGGRREPVVAVLASTAYEPMNVHAGPPAGPLSPLSDTRPELRAITWGRQERLSYRASDGLGLDGLLILPPGKSRDDGPYPLVTLVHGGPYARYADQLTLGVIPSAQWLAGAGVRGVPAEPAGRRRPRARVRGGGGGWRWAGRSGRTSSPGSTC